MLLLAIGCPFANYAVRLGDSGLGDFGFGDWDLGDSGLGDIVLKSSGFEIFGVGW